MIVEDGRHRFSFDVRTKLLVLLALVSLPLFLISLYQVNSYQRNLNEQTETITRVEANAAAGALEAWLDYNPQYVAGADTLPAQVAADLHSRILQQSTPGTGAAIAVRDAAGHVLPQTALVAGTLTNTTPVVPPDFAVDALEVRWSDQVARITAGRRVSRYGWGVVLGVPRPTDTPAGRSVVIVTVTWGLALLASIFLSIWAVGRFTKPLQKLAASATTLGAGRLQERVAVETRDEVGTLAAGFNAMASNLEGKFNELNAQSAFITDVLDSLPLGVVVLDANLVVRKVNAAFAGFVGREAEALQGRSLYEAATGLATLGEVIDEVRRTRKAFVNYGLPLELDMPHEGEGNAKVDEVAKHWDVILWPASQGGEERADLLVILSEVSQRVRAERLATSAFAAEKARGAELASVINQMDEGVVIVDKRGRYRVNPAAAHILGRPPGAFRDGVEALIADMALRNSNGEVLPASETPLGRALERGEHVSGEHLQIVRGDGEEGVLAVSATPLTIEDSVNTRREGVVAVFRDITNDVRQYRELMDAYRRLREHDRLKSAFVANVSHELRTPLNVIIGLCQLLERDRRAPLAPRQHEAVTRMGRNARSLLELVNDLLDYSRLEAGHSALHLEAVDVGEVAAQVLDDYRVEADDKKIELRADIAPQLGTVYTDRHKLEKVLTNLVGNAVKFTTAGAVTISAAALDDEHWVLEVNDTGIGMSREAMEFIFDEFRQVDDNLTRSYSGVGLGLAITRKLVELLEGEIKVESQPDAGSRFRITWPRHARPRTGTGSLVPDARPSSLFELSRPRRVNEPPLTKRA